MNRVGGLIAGALLCLASVAEAASLPAITGPIDPGNALQTFNQVVQSVNQNASGYQALNLLDNGAMQITQRGTGIATGGTTSGPGVTAYPADRWAIECNVTSCAPRGAVVTSASGVTFAPAFANMLSVYRNSGALTQPICAEQEIPTPRFTMLQGRQVILSAWIAANALFPTGGAVTGYLVTGTGSDQGLGALRSAVGMTASPALTPALTGVATASATLSATPTSTATRYSSSPIQVPATATEGIVMFCFTPSTETAGTTNGFLMTGAQLEEADPNQTTAGRYYRTPLAEELLRAQRFYFQYVETNGAYFCPGIASATNVQTLTCYAPVPMDTLPVLAVTAGGFSYRDNGSALAVSSPVVSSASEVGYRVITITDGATQTVAHTAPLYGTNTTGKLTFSADF